MCRIIKGCNYEEIQKPKQDEGPERTEPDPDGSWTATGTPLCVPIHINLVALCIYYITWKLLSVLSGQILKEVWVTVWFG